MSEQKKFKSTRTQLESRGFIEHFDIYPNKRLKDESIKNLNDKAAVTRSIAARHLVPFANEKDVCTLLLNRLTIEKALYTRMEICKTLQHAEQQVPLLLTYITKIPNHQYKELPKRTSKKVSFPLPRDLIARTLGRMDIEILPTLLDNLVMRPLKYKRELVPAIGYLLFTQEFADDVIFKILKAEYKKTRDSVLKWKIIIVMGVLLPYSEEFLRSIKDNGSIYYKEAQKALSKVECHTTAK